MARSDSIEIVRCTSEVLCVSGCITENERQREAEPFLIITSTFEEDSKRNSSRSTPFSFRDTQYLYRSEQTPINRSERTIFFPFLPFQFPSTPHSNRHETPIQLSVIHSQDGSRSTDRVPGAPTGMLDSLFCSPCPAFSLHFPCSTSNRSFIRSLPLDSLPLSGFNLDLLDSQLSLSNLIDSFVFEKK